MDIYSNRFLKSEYHDNELTLKDLKSSSFHPFKNLIQYIRTLYTDRLYRLESTFSNLKSWESCDPVLKVMKENQITEQFLSARSEEIFNLCLKNETEKTIEMLQIELTKKQFEIFRLEQIIFESKSSQSQISSKKFPSASLQTNFKELWEKERTNGQTLMKEIEEKKNEILEMKEFLREKMENQEFQETRGTDRGLASENIEEKYKRKVSAYKRKILEQRQVIDQLQVEINQIRNKGNDVYSHFEGNLKKEQQIKQDYEEKIRDLQAHYEKIMENKLKEIHEEIHPNLRVVSEEKFYEVCREKLELERKLSGSYPATSDHPSPNSKKHVKFESSSKEREENQQLHSKIFQLESKSKHLENLNKTLENQMKTLEKALHPKPLNHSSQIPKLKKLKDQNFLLKSHLSSLKQHLNHLNSSFKSEIRNFQSMTFKLFSENSSKLSFLILENKDLRLKLRSSSEAFDKIQEEVKSASINWKKKAKEKVEKISFQLKQKYEKEYQERQIEFHILQSKLNQSASSLSSNEQLIKHLKDEITHLRDEREEIKKKQQTIEEKFLSQSSNLRLQLKNKQLELDLMRKTLN